MEKRSNFSSFPHYFIYIFLTSGVKLHIHLLNVVVHFIVFPTLSTLICRGTDISKCFSESLGIRDNESRLYIVNCISYKNQINLSSPTSNEFHHLKMVLLDYTLCADKHCNQAVRACDCNAQGSV